MLAFDYPAPSTDVFLLFVSVMFVPTGPSLVLVVQNVSPPPPIGMSSCCDVVVSIC